MKRYVHAIWLLFLIASWVWGQESAPLGDVKDLYGRKIPKALFQVVSVDFNNTPFETALASIAEQGNIKLNYNREKMPLRQTVTLRMNNVYAIEALLSVLKRTGTNLVFSKEGQLILGTNPSGPIETTSAEADGVIAGTVRDSKSGEPLPGANLLIKGTVIGAASALDGRYRIRGVPAGEHVLRVTYLGYKDREIPVKLTTGETVRLEIKLDFDVIKTKYEVTVTAQQEGQAAAVNQQIRSNTIVNVVSKDKIQELPDQNAAESVGRLPGIAIQRSAGEGQKVVVRGLSPRFSAVTVNSERLPETSDDRSVDLTMISPDALAGIEIYKSIRPDIDGDAVGGSVNFITKKAPEGARLMTRLFGGYNQLGDDYGNYKGSLSYSNRFFHDENGAAKLGVVATGSLQRANRSSDYLTGIYAWSGVVNDRDIYQTNSVLLMDHSEIRDRYNLNLALDYNLSPNHAFIFNSLYGRTNRDVESMSHNYVILGTDNHRYYDESESALDMWSNSLAGEHLFGPLEVNWRASYATMVGKTPWYAHFDFGETDAFTKDLDAAKVDPMRLPTYAKNDAYRAWLDHSWVGNNKVTDRHVTGQLDIKYPFTLGKAFSGYFKVGGKMRDKHREKDINEFGGDRWHTGQRVNQYYNDWFIDVTGVQEDIALINFVDKTKQKYTGFLNGDYDYVEILNPSKLHWFATTFDSIYKKFNQHKNVDAQDYAGNETISAGYAMMEFNWRNKLMFMPGIRYERTYTDYAMKWVKGIGDQEVYVQPAFKDTLGNRSYDNFLPMFHLRLRPLNWFDIRLASTASISRPDFYSLIPYELIEWSYHRLRTGNPYLKETTAKNYDAFLSFYNRYGLFTVGTFYKELKNIDYVRTSNRIGGYYSPYIPNLKGWEVTSPENLPNISTAKGWEFELQTNLKFLPSPLDGILIYANYSRIKSETQYPDTKVETKITTLPTPPYYQIVTKVIDATRINRMIGQADQIANLTLGYEKYGFSGRLSMIYQGNSLQSVGQLEENDGLTDDLMLWDLMMQQRIFKGFKLVAQVNNLTGEEENSFIRYKEWPTRREYYGRTIDIGVQYEY